MFDDTFRQNFKNEYETCPVLAYTTISASIAVALNLLMLFKGDTSMAQFLMNMVVSLLIVYLFFYLCKTGRENIGYLLIGSMVVLVFFLYGYSSKLYKKEEKCINACVKKCIDENDDN